VSLFAETLQEEAGFEQRQRLTKSLGKTRRIYATMKFVPNIMIEAKTPAKTP
jgi:hypothetical protein